MAEVNLLSSCLLSLVVCLLLLLHTAAGDSMSACFSGANKSLDLDCGAGYMLHITRTFYGFSPTGQCRLVDGEAGSGCTVDDHVRNPCIGQRSCSINLPTGQWGVNVPTCGQRSNYYQVEYTCVLASSVTDICQKQRLTAQSGYLMTPRYPANYRDQADCSTTILAHPSQKLNLHIIDMELEARGRSDCADLLYFNDKLRSITLCGQRTNYSYNMHSNYLHIELQSSSGGLSKGFWLYYEAVPPLPTSLLPPVINTSKNDKVDAQSDDNAKQVEDSSDSSNINNRGSEDDEVTTPKYVHPKSTVPLYRNSSGPGKSLPFAAIAGGVIGTLSLILVILLLLLFIKWCKERRYYKAEKILEIRNPAFRSSSDFHESQSNNSGYYC